MNLNDTVYKVCPTALSPLTVLQGRIAGETPRSWKVEWRDRGVSGVVDVIGKAVWEHSGIGGAPEEAVALYEAVIRDRMERNDSLAVRDRERIEAISAWRKR